MRREKGRGGEGREDSRGGGRRYEKRRKTAGDKEGKREEKQRERERSGEEKLGLKDIMHGGEGGEIT